MTDLAKLIDDVAREYATSSPYCNDLATVLKRRLLPLLEAGQAMRDSILFCPTQPECLRWDAALKAAREGKE